MGAMQPDEETRLRVEQAFAARKRANIEADAARDRVEAEVLRALELGVRKAEIARLGSTSRQDIEEVLHRAARKGRLPDG